MEEKTPFFERPAVWFPLLLGVYLLCVGIKAHLFLPSDPNGVYSPVYQTETALHYRHAKMVSDNLKVPAVDRDLQYPDGYEVFKRSEVFEEYAAGLIHRVFFPRAVFNRFVEEFVWWWSSLSVIGIFFLALLLTRRKGLSLVAALFYAVAAATTLRSVNGMFLREIFTIPIMLAHMSLMIFSLRSGKVWPAIIAGPVAYVILGSWQISQFYYLIVILFPVLTHLLTRDRRPLFRPYLLFFSGQAVFLTLAGLTIPYLKTLGFLGFWGLGLTWAFLVVLVVDRFISLPVWLRGLMLAGVTVLLHFAAPGRVEMNWVFQTAVLKLRYFLKKPEDPSLLPLAVRSIWTGPFRSPSLFNVLYIISTYWFWAIAAAIVLIRRFLSRRTGPEENFLLYLLLAFFSVYILFDRLAVLFMIPVSVGAAYLLGFAGPMKKAVRLAAVLGALLSLGFETAKIWTTSKDRALLGSTLSELSEKSKSDEFGLPMDQAVEVFEWFKKYTDPADPVFTRYAMSPALLLYTGHPVFLTPIFDPVFLRKLQTLESAWFVTERRFNAIAASNNIGFVLYYPDVYLYSNPYSLRYQVGLKRGSTNEVSYLFQFHPERLKDFELVHQNSFLRVFKRRDVRLKGTLPPSRYSPLFDEGTFREMAVGPEQFLERWNKAFSMKRLIDDILKQKQFGPATVGLREVLGLFPRYPEALNATARLSLQRGDIATAENYLRQSIAIAPTAEAEYGLVMISSRSKTRAQLIAEMERVHAMDPAFFPPFMDLISFYRQAARFEDAARIAGEMIQTYPQYAEGYRMLREIYFAMGRLDLADRVVQPRAGGTSSSGNSLR